MLDRHALNSAGKVERPGHRVGIGGIDPLDDFHLLRGEVLVPAELFEHGQGELGISVLDFGADRIGALGEEIVVILPFDLLPVLHHLAFDDAFDTEPGAERAAAFLHRKIGVVEDRRAGMLELRRSPARPRQAVIVAADFRVILRRPHGHQIEFGLVLHVSLEPFGRLPAIARRPAAAIDLAQNIFRRAPRCFRP